MGNSEFSAWFPTGVEGDEKPARLPGTPRPDFTTRVFSPTFAAKEGEPTFAAVQRGVLLAFPEIRGRRAAMALSATTEPQAFPVAAEVLFSIPDAVFLRFPVVL